MPGLTLDKLVPGESGRVVRIHGRGAVRHRLVDMGLTCGAVIDVVKLSPLGDPVEYRLRGYHLSLRKSEARTIEVELVGSSRHACRPRHQRGMGLSLSGCPSGEQVEVIGLRGGGKARQRLQELGLQSGSQITVIQNEFPGPIIIAEGDDNRLEIGKGLARHILVKPAS